MINANNCAEAVPLLQTSLYTEASALRDCLREMLERSPEGAEEEEENHQHWMTEHMFGDEEEDGPARPVRDGPVSASPTYAPAEPEPEQQVAYSPTSPTYGLVDERECGDCYCEDCHCECGCECHCGQLCDCASDDEFDPLERVQVVFRPTSPINDPVEPVALPAVPNLPNPIAAAPEMRVVQVVDLAGDDGVEAVVSETIAVRHDRRSRKRRLVSKEPEPVVAAPVETCPVCLDAVDRATLTPCGHLFCYECIFHVLAVGGQGCPLCRGNISTESQLVSVLEA